MKITVFDASNGDAILLQSDAGKNILIDGGRGYSFTDNIASLLGDIRRNGDKLDLVCISHFDQDHIGGILRMLDTEFDWRVHNYQKAQNLKVKKPKSDRPPEIQEIWHNSFFEDKKKNRGDIEDQLAAIAAISLATGNTLENHGSNLFSRLATSMKESAQVSRRIGNKQLSIPLNDAFNGKFVVRKNAPIIHQLGDLEITVLGPTHKRLKDLRDKWQKWLNSSSSNHKKQLKALKRDGKEDEEALRNGDLAAFFGLADLEGALGNPGSVTEPNVASIVLFFDQGGKRFLSTGDAKDETILNDLRDCKLLDSDDQIHVDVLKIPHHGSKNNFSSEFARKVTADHYVFCSNGHGTHHHHPDLPVVKQVVASRIGTTQNRTKNPEADKPFKLWFSSDGTTRNANEAHFKKLREYMDGIGNPNCKFLFSGSKYFQFTI